ncbi:MAG: response regulator transcription factor, partial [Actinomycetota bacterium]
MRILIIEDNESVRSAVRRALTARGHDVVEAATAADGRMAVDDRTDAIVLDVGLPDASGFDVCRTLRETGVRIPISMLTARDAVQDRVEGLDAGADDYLVKPFATVELDARLRAIARRSLADPAAEDELLEAAGVRLDLAS